MLPPAHRFSDKPMLVVLLLASEVVPYSPRRFAGGRTACAPELCEAREGAALVRCSGCGISEGFRACRVMVTGVRLAGHAPFSHTLAVKLPRTCPASA